MAFQRGDVVLIPFPYTDLSATKTRPAVVVSSRIYQNIRSELLLAYISSQISKANAVVDYILTDWQAAGLLKPSFVRPKVAALEPNLVVHQVGGLSQRDLHAVDRRLRQAMALTETALTDLVAEVDLMTQPVELVQAIAEKAITTIVSLERDQYSGVDTKRLAELLKG